LWNLPTTFSISPFSSLVSLAGYSFKLAGQTSKVLNRQSLVEYQAAAVGAAVETGSA
jgi:hypothetical protein